MSVRVKLTHKRLTGPWKRSQDFKESLEILVLICDPNGVVRREGLSRGAKTSLYTRHGCLASRALIDT